jgi:hypothetical protein
MRTPLMSALLPKADIRTGARYETRRPSHYAELARPAIVRDRLIGAVLDDDLDARSETDALRSEV